MVVGFKSRALRVGGTAELPAAEAAASESAPGAGRAAVAQLSSTPIPPPAVASATGAPAEAEITAGEDDATAAGRKRRAGDGSTPSPKTSPKLAATYKDGQQCKTQPDEAAGAAGASCSVQAAGVPVAGGVKAASSRNAVAGNLGSNTDTTGGDGSSTDDSVPLVSSKLAARLAQDRGTPLPAKGGDNAGEAQTAGAQVACCMLQYVGASHTALRLVTGFCRLNSLSLFFVSVSTVAAGARSTAVHAGSALHVASTPKHCIWRLSRRCRAVQAGVMRLSGPPLQRGSCQAHWTAPLKGELSRSPAHRTWQQQQRGEAEAMPASMEGGSILIPLSSSSHADSPAAAQQLSQAAGQQQRWIQMVINSHCRR